MKIIKNYKILLVTTALFGSLVALGLVSRYFPVPFGQSEPGSVQEVKLPPDTNLVVKPPSSDSAYTSIIKSYDTYFLAKDYDNCLRELEKAQKIKPREQSVKDRILKIKGLIADGKQKSEEAQKAVTSGDTYFGARDYLNAKASYQLAVGLTPDDPAVKEKLAKTMNLLRSQKASNTLYDVAVASADKLFQEKDYEKAKLEYENAGKILPGEVYPKNKINEIIKIQVDLQVKGAAYSRYLTSADKFYTAKNFIAALSDYKNALAIRPSEKYPQDRINELTTIIAAQKTKDDAYKLAISLADQNFNQARYTESVKGYQEALTIKPEETYPKSRIREIEGILARNQVATEEYEKYVSLADSLYIGKNYLKARENYLNAISVKPKESYPKEMLSKAEKMLTGQEASMARSLDEQYAAAIAMADKLLAGKSFEPARSEYLKSTNLKPLEQYPKDKILEIDRALSDQKAIENHYKATIAEADKLLTVKSFEAARVEFNKAIVLKPGDQYALSKIEAIKLMLDELAQSQTRAEQYKTLIASADRQLADKSYEPAKSDYKKALALKPGETYPKSKIAEIDRLMQDMEQSRKLQANYDKAVRRGDSLMMLSSWEPAKTEFLAALKIKPTEAYPISKVGEIDKVLADVQRLKTLDDQYAGSIASGDKLFSDKKYETARVAYQRAGELKPAEQYPKDKVAEISSILDGLAARKVLDDRYNAAVLSADKLFAAKSLELARAEYVNAGGIKPNEKYPGEMIAKIDQSMGELAAKKALEDQYSQTIAAADKQFSEKLFDLAKQGYQQAMAIKPTAVYPPSKITEIDKILAEVARQKALDEDYLNANASGDKLLAQKSYIEAKAQYGIALNLKPAEKYPKDKIAEVEAALAEIAQLKSLEDQYTGAIDNGDKFLTEKKYEAARESFLNAGRIKPAEQYPKDKVAEIAAILEGIAKQNALDARYQSSVLAADKLLAAQSLEQARAEYVNAGNIKPGEQYPKDKMKEIDATLASIAARKALDEQYASKLATADKQFSDKAWDEAKLSFQAAVVLKPAESYPKSKIEEIERIQAELSRVQALDDQYKKAIAAGDLLFSAKSYAEAKLQFSEALKLKPAEQYPKDRILDADKALAEIAKQKSLDDQYTGVLTKADALFAQKSYTEARSEYAGAQVLKPTEKYPKEKITEIESILSDIAIRKKAFDDSYKASIGKADQLFAARTYEMAKNEYLNAESIKPDERYPKLKVVEIDSVLAGIAKKKAFDEEYTKVLAAGDKLLAAASFAEARTAFQQAAVMKPAEQYPRQKIVEAETGIADKDRKKAIDERYATGIANADKLLEEKSYELARTAFLDAGKIKPAEQYPKDKVAEITTTLSAIARQKLVDDQFKTILAKADQLLLSKTYPQARLEFENALKVKPAEQYPKDKVAEIDAILAQIKAREDEYRTLISKADQLLIAKSYELARTEYQNAGVIMTDLSYPRDKIAEINRTLTELKGKKQTYDDLVADGDGMLQQKDWGRAKDLFRQALVIFPEETYPKQRIALVDSKIDSLYRANKSRYDKAVADGDRFFNTFEFDKAVDAFLEAISLLPMENYPKEMITKIRRTISENAIVDVLNSTVTIAAGSERQFSFQPVNMASRKNNFVYLKIRNLSNKPFNILMRYGKDKQANGGVVIRNLSLDGKVNERLVGVRDQDLWYREDNNWISLIPQGGDIEVSFIQVSRAK